MEELLSKYNFTPEEIKEFISNSLVINCPKRTVLLREGETPRFFYWATKGIFRAGYTDRKGNDITRTFFTPDTVPFVAAYGNFVTQTPSLSFLEAIEEGEVLSWHFDYIKKIEETDNKWLRFFKKQLDIVILLRDIKEWQFYTLPPDELYLAFIEKASTFIHRVPQHYIASYIGVSPEALSRIRGRINAERKSKNKKS
jgi:CRP-like cAMP-binding protein